VVQEAYPVIVKSADDPNPEIRKRVAVALATYQTGFQTADLQALVEPALTKLLNDPDPAVSQSAVSMLRQNYSYRGQMLLKKVEK
jgi:vesicle coat complex subunit